MTSILPAHAAAAIGKAGFNALPKDARTAVADRTLGSAPPRLFISTVNIDHLIKKIIRGCDPLFHFTPGRMATGRVKGQMKADEMT